MSDSKSKELIAITSSVLMICEFYIDVHLQRALLPTEPVNEKLPSPLTQLHS
ncbi:MAG TPA: hypothetical protein HA262_06115 [Methanosarcina sp.]|nr:hypothetical protein [Methanosarcina sp.]